MSGATIRPATSADDAALLALDNATWSSFVVEGVLREEFLLDGRYVDDVLMALTLSNEGAA